MAVSKSTRRIRPRTNPTAESILRGSSITSERRQAWKAAQRQANELSSLRFPAYEQLYLLNLYAQEMTGLLKEIGGQFGNEDFSSYHQALIEEIRSQASQHILESMNGVEITDSMLHSQLRMHQEKLL